MMFNKKGQSVSEYAIILGLVIAVAAGVTQILLKGAIREKQTKAIVLIDKAGGGAGTNDFVNATALNLSSTKIYDQELRQTVINSSAFVDSKILHKGGAEERKLLQNQTTPSSAVVTIEANK